MLKKISYILALKTAVAEYELAENAKTLDPLIIGNTVPVKYE